MLTPAQQALLKADANATQPAMVAAENWPGLANYYNTLHVVFTVWKTLVPLTKVGDAMDSTEVIALTPTNLTTLQVFAQYAPEGINASLPDRRAAFDKIFLGTNGAKTRAALLILWKRLAKNGEKVLADISGGNGLNATPALLTFEGDLAPDDIRLAVQS
jgi:hypothetical protein